jgi:hypothetical protein
MANGYIGKISALVTASTADLSRKLQGGTRDVNRFANSVNAQIAGASSSARKSLEGIFTPLQRAQRAFSAGLALNLIDEAQVRRLQQTVSIAEQISKPLGAASRVFQGLSADVAAGLVPALLRAQDAAQRVNDEVGTTGGVTASSYRVAEQAIDRAAAAFERFRQAEQIIGSAPRGRELQFDDPQLFEALQRSADARRGAAAPGVASRVGGALGDAVREVTRFDDLVAQAASRISGIRLAPQVDTSQLERAQGEYQDLLVQQRRAVEELNRLSVAPPPDPGRGFVLRQQPDQPRGLGLFGRQAGSEADAAVERAQRLDAVFKALPQSARAAVGGLAGIAARVADEVATAGTGVAQLNAVLDILEGRLSTSSAAAAAQAERVRQSGEAAREAAAKLTSLATAIQAALGNARPTVDSLEQDFRRLLEVVQKSPAGRTAFKPILDELLELFTAARNGADNLDQIIAKLNQLRSAGARGASGGLTILSDADVQADKAKQAARTIQEARDALSQRILGGFGGAGEAGLNLGIDERSLRAIGGQIEFVQNRLSLLGQEARGPVLAALEALRVRANALFRGGAIDTEEGRNELQLLRQELIRTLAAAEGGVGTAGIEAGLNRAGDVGRLGVDKLQLGLQQAAFAVDDFFSVTGDLQQRIRAVGNNLTQLGFIVGNTKGLWIALGGVLALQVISQVIKYANANVEAADRTKALNEALARQKSLVEELAQAFRSLGDTILRGVFTPAADEARQFAQALEEIRKKQAEVRESRLTEFSPDVVQRRSEVQARQREFDAATTPEARLAAATALRQARDREQEAVRAAARPIPARRLDDEIQQAVQRSIDIERRSRTDFDTGALLGEDRFLEALRRGGRQAEIEAARAAGDGLGANRIQREELQTRLREVEALGDGPDSREAALILRQALDRLDFAEALGLDDAAREIFKDAGETATGIREAREKLSEAIEAGVPGARAASEALNAAGESLSAAQQRIIDRVEAGLPVDRELVDAARAEREAAQKALEARQKEVVAFDSTRQALDRFAAALDLASQEAQSNLQSAQQAADEARRADLGRSTPATRQARQQADADLARQRELATGVEEEVAAARERAAGGQSPPGLEASVRRIQEIDQLLGTQGVLASGQREELARERARLEQQAVEADEQVRRARDESTREAEQAAAAVRGRELSRTDGERAAADLTRGIEDIRQFFGRQAEEGTGLVDFEAQAAAQQRFIDQSLRSAAPAIFGLADQVQNAVLQGPSRAALQATDVSTVEGSRELNRLLRGDDSARDQNLVELQKQSQALDELVRIAREGGVEIAN